MIYFRISNACLLLHLLPLFMWKMEISQTKIHSNIVGVFKNNTQSLPTARQSLTMTGEFDVFLQKPFTQENVLPLTPKLQEVKKCMEGLCICLFSFPLPFTELITHHKLVLSLHCLLSLCSPCMCTNISPPVSRRQGQERPIKRILSSMCRDKYEF